MALARGCEQEENVESIITWLSGKDNWLLIMDNADDQFLDISRFFPAGNRGSIVITTRNPDFQRYATVGSYKVDRMHPEDAITLLLKGSAVQDTENAETRKLAREVVDVLGCLALAIIQAAAVLRQQLCSLSGFCELYSKYKQELLESGRPLPTDDYQYSVYTTWEISIKKIQDMTDTHARLALDLLQTFSFMHFEGIHEGLFRRAREHVDLGYWESWDGYVREILFVKYMPSGWDQLLMGKALGLLLAFSLVNIDEDRQVSIHPLVHGWAGHRMSAEERRKYWMIAAATLAMSTNRKRNISEYRHRKVLLPHVEFCLACEDNQLFSEGSDLKGRLDAVFLFAAIYFENGHVEKALNLSLQDLKLKEIMFPPENIARSTTAIMAVTLLSSARRFEEAIELITILVEALGKTGDDKGILLSMNNWAQALASLGRHQQAVDKCKEALDSFERSFGSESHDILETNSIIARSYLAMGRPKEALELAEKVLEVRMKLYQEYNFALVASMEFVAEVQAALKLFIRARKAQEMYLSWLTTIDGRYHPRTIFALNTMADYHSRIGKFMHGVGIRGLICRREVVERSKIAFGMTDPRTIGFMARLAEDYYNGLAFAKAEQLQEQVVKEMVQAFGEDHKEVIESKEFLAQIRSMGRFYRTIYWWVPKPLSGIEFWLDGAGARLFKESLIITGG
jgi:tetratricopeptide (TPR) repeat protein